MVEASSPKKVGVLCIHGIGYKAKAHFSDPLVKLLEKGGEYEIKHREVLWGNALDRYQDEMLDHFVVNPYKGLKVLLGRTIADAIAYQPIKDRDSLYTTIHNGLSAVLEDFVDCDVIVLVGHSLGSIILSNFLWDISKSGDYPDTFGMLKEKHVILTLLGSPYSYYSFRTGKSFYPIPRFSKGFEIANFHNTKDIVSAPITELPHHNENYIMDYKVRNLPWRNMFINAHLNYFNNSKIARVLDTYIKGALNV